jgi:hypothetical protein
MDIRRKLSLKMKATQDDEERPRWIGKKLKLHRKQSALKDTWDHSTQNNHIDAASNFKEGPPRFRDQAVEALLDSLMATVSPSVVLNCMLVCRQWSRVGKGVLQQANRFSQLPEEILVDIFERVRFISTGTQESITADIASCARTCQQWRRIASPLLYQHFVLNVNYDYTSDTKEYKFHPPFKLWWWQPFQIPTVATWMQTLTIELHFNEAGPADRRITLIGFITSLPNLTTLSIRAAPLQQQHYIARAQLALIVAAVPSTVTNFELDTKGRDVSSNLSRQDYRLCEALNRLLPQLHHLRLRMGVMCPLFITATGVTGDLKYPNLEICTIFLLTRDLCRPAACCRPHQWSLENRPDDKLLGRLSEKIASNCFPSLKRCTWVHLDRETALVWPNYGPNYGSIEVKRWSDESRVWNIEKVDIRNSSYADGGFMFYRQVLFKPSDTFATSVNSLQAEQWVEGDAAWVSDANGARRPR